MINPHHVCSTCSPMSMPDESPANALLDETCTNQLTGTSSNECMVVSVNALMDFVKQRDYEFKRFISHGQFGIPYVALLGDELNRAVILASELRNELITVIKSKVSTSKSINDEVLLPLESLINKIRNNEIS